MIRNKHHLDVWQAHVTVPLHKRCDVELTSYFLSLGDSRDGSSGKTGKIDVGIRANLIPLGGSDPCRIFRGISSSMGEAGEASRGAEGRGLGILRVQGLFGPCLF